MIQFIKGEWYYGELTSSKRLEPEFEMIAAGKGFVGILDDDHTLERASRRGAESNDPGDRETFNWPLRRNDTG